MPHTLLLLRGFYLVNGLSGGILVPYLSLLLLHDGLTSNQVGEVMALGTLIAILGQPIWGYLVDRFSLTRLTLAMSSLIPGLIAIFYDSTWLTILALTSVLSNLFLTPQAPIADSYAVAFARTNGTPYGTIRLFGSLGFALGGYAGGLYLTHVSVTALWIPYAVLGISGAVLAFFFPRPSMSVGVGSSISEGFKELMRDRRFLVFLTGGFLISQTLTAFNTYFAITFRQMGGSLSLTGLAFFIASGTNVPAMLVAARMIARFGRESTMFLAAVAYIVRWGVQAFVPNPTVAIAIQVLHGLSFGFFYVAAVDFVSQTARKELQATAQSIFGMVNFGVAGILGNLVNGELLHSGSAQLMYEVCMGSAFLGAVCFAYVIKTAPKAARPGTLRSSSVSR